MTLWKIRATMKLTQSVAVRKKDALVRIDVMKLLSYLDRETIPCDIVDTN